MKDIKKLFFISLIILVYYFFFNKSNNIPKKIQIRHPKINHKNDIVKNKILSDKKSSKHTPKTSKISILYSTYFDCDNYGTSSIVEKDSTLNIIDSNNSYTLISNKFINSNSFFSKACLTIEGVKTPYFKVNFTGIDNLNYTNYINAYSGKLLIPENYSITEIINEPLNNIDLRRLTFEEFIKIAPDDAYLSFFYSSSIDFAKVQDNLGRFNYFDFDLKIFILENFYDNLSYKYIQKYVHNANDDLLLHYSNVSSDNRYLSRYKTGSILSSDVKSFEIVGFTSYICFNIEDFSYLEVNLIHILETTGNNIIYDFTNDRKIYSFYGKYLGFSCVGDSDKVILNGYDDFSF